MDSILDNSTINVFGTQAPGVRLQRQEQETSKKARDGRESASSQKQKGSSSSKSKQENFDYTEYADPKNIDNHHFDVLEEDKKPSYESYRVSGKGIKRRGYALIINVSSNGPDERKGSENDVKKMASLWKKLDFEIVVQKSADNTTKAEILRALQKAAGLYGGFGVIVIIIMSHGTVKDGEEVFATADSKFIKFNDVISLFDNKSAKSLRGTPKLFFFQYCRGNLRDFLEEDEAIALEELPNLESDEEDFYEDGETDLPLRSDMMIAHASMQGYKALRSAEHGSPFFNVIANVFMRHAKYEHVLELMTRVNSAMAARTYDWERKRRKQMNEIQFDLTKLLYLLE